MSEPFVFLIGAGASKSIGIPVMKDFRKEFEEFCRDKSSLNDPLQVLLGYDRKQDLEEMLINLYSLSRLKDSIEARVMLEDWSQFTKKSSSHRRISRQIAGKVTTTMKKDLIVVTNEYHKLETAALDFINEKCLNIDYKKAKTVYEELLAGVSTSGAKIFTTNYDPIIEEVCQKESILQEKYADGFSYDPVEGMKVWDFEWDQFNKKSIGLYKLHGSVTWYRDETTEKIVQLPIKLGEEAKLKGGKKMYHLLIYPATLKDIYTYPFFDLYLEFLKTLEQTRILISIGHSFRDPYIRAAIEKKLKDPNFVLIVISPSHQPEQRELANITMNRERVIHCPFKFEDFTSTLIQFISDYQRNKKDTIDNLRKEMEKELKKKISPKKGEKGIIQVKKTSPRAKPPAQSPPLQSPPPQPQQSQPPQPPS